MADIQPGILALIAITFGLGLLVFVVVTTTSFLKISVVLFLGRRPGFFGLLVSARAGRDG